MEPKNETLEESFKEKIGGFAQKIIGEIEEIGGVLTGDPTTIAEGELNAELGEIREEIEETATDEVTDQ